MLYHHSYEYLEPGDVVRAGNWGRIVQGYGGQHPIFFREALWELVRKREYPTVPSRLTAAYYYDDEQVARNGMREGDQGRAPNLYEVELVTPMAATHRADLHLWERAWWDAHQPTEAESIARAYWAGHTPTGRTECLTNSDLRILKVIERSRPR
ncbi:hypothetical protein [Nocardioides sp. NPDC004968]|uniref:hypothetical protein n=1 Tax=Nocardioides sp. NPDC004968 TaxID=3155894 RepID=UPI0033BBCE19